MTFNTYNLMLKLLTYYPTFVDFLICIPIFCALGVASKICMTIERNQALARIEQAGRNTIVPASASASVMRVIGVNARPVIFIPPPPPMIH